MPRSARRSQHQKRTSPKAAPIATMARGRTRSFCRRMPRRSRYRPLFEGMPPQTGALRGNLSAEPCDGQTYFARVEASHALIASRQCRRRSAFLTQLRHCASRLHTTRRDREGCRTSVARCHVADRQNICNAISSMRPAVGILKERRFALACNVLARHEVFSAPWRDRAHGNPERSVARKYSRSDREFD
jgi:hypothetical protein